MYKLPILEKLAQITAENGCSAGEIASAQTKIERIKSSQLEDNIPLNVQYPILEFYDLKECPKTGKISLRKKRKSRAKTPKVTPKTTPQNQKEEGLSA